MKLGIVGSSWSTGKHNDGKKDLAKPFEYWFDGIDVVNCAASSRGTELYLNKVVYMKKEHNIDTLLMESVNNRSMWNIKCNVNNYKIIEHETDINKIINSIYQTSDGAWYHMRSLFQEINYQLFGTEREFEIWKKFQQSVAVYQETNEFWALTDMGQTVDLCNMLGINVVVWANRWEMEKLPSFSNVVKNCKYIKFGKFLNAYEYYADKYGEDNILCDGAHFTDKINEEMVNNFILPALTKL